MQAILQRRHTTTRVVDGPATDSDTRADILRLLRNEPGISLSEICDRLGTAWGTTVHHLQRLESRGRITSLREGRHRHFFAPHVPHRERHVLIAKRKPDYAGFLRLVQTEPGITLEALSTSLGRDRSGVSRTGSRLEQMGLVQKRREWKRIGFHPATGAASG